MVSHIRETKLPLMLGSIRSAAAELETARECATECAIVLGSEFVPLEIQLEQLSHLAKAALRKAMNAAGSETSKPSSDNGAATRQ